MKLTRVSVFLVLTFALVFIAAGFQTVWAQQQQPPAGVSFAKVGPIFQNRCAVCHSGPKAPKGLRLDTYENTIKGGNEKVVVPGDPGKSEILQRVTGAKTPRMPRGGPPWLSQPETALIEEWIATGARP